jgi:hypothetical protein
LEKKVFQAQNVIDFDWDNLSDFSVEFCAKNNLSPKTPSDPLSNPRQLLKFNSCSRDAGRNSTLNIGASEPGSKLWPLRSMLLKTQKHFRASAKLLSTREYSRIESTARL